MRNYRQVVEHSLYRVRIKMMVSDEVVALEII
jgi:hypothetical protein